MNETWVPETSPHLPTWLSRGAGYRVSCLPTQQGLHSDSASLQNPNVCAPLPPEGSLWSNLWPNLPSCGVGSVFLTHPHWHGRVCTEDHGTRLQVSISIVKKGLHWGCNTWEQILLFSLFAWTLYINQVLEHCQFSMSASIQWKLWTESLELMMTTCCLLLFLAATKVARSFQKIRMGEPPIYPTAKIQITALLHV